MQSVRTIMRGRRSGKTTELLRLIRETPESTHVIVCCIGRSAMNRMIRLIAGIRPLDTCSIIVCTLAYSRTRVLNIAKERAGNVEIFCDDYDFLPRGIRTFLLTDSHLEGVLRTITVDSEYSILHVLNTNTIQLKFKSLYFATQIYLG